jgi:hypothetical protein
VNLSPLSGPAYFLERTVTFYGFNLTHARV